MIYNPEISYRCTIIRGKSQTDLEDLLPLYANMVHKYCPATEAAFKQGCRRDLSRVLFGTNSYETLSRSNQKTVDNHLTEIAGTLLGLYYPSIENGTTYINESASCKYLFDFNDFPTFFKNLCLNFQFTNGAKSAKYVQEDIDNNQPIGNRMMNDYSSNRRTYDEATKTWIDNSAYIPTDIPPQSVMQPVSKNAGEFKFPTQNYKYAIQGPNYAVDHPSPEKVPTP